MTVISHANLGLVSTPIFYIILLLSLPAALEVRIYEVAFFVSVWLHNNFILSEKKYSASKTQKQGLDWTLNDHCLTMTERLIRCQTACIENTVFIHMYSRLIIILLHVLLQHYHNFLAYHFQGNQALKKLHKECCQIYHCQSVYW